MFMTFHKRTYSYVSWIIASSLGIPVAATLPPQLQSAVPVCAQFCLTVFIEEEFSGICNEPTTLDCLCTHVGYKGYALADRITLCIESANCTGFPQTNIAPVAAVCTLVPGGITTTHTSTATLTSIIALSTTASAANSTSARATFTSTFSQPPSSATGMAQVSASAGPDGVSMSGKVSLTMAQIAGITIAAVALLILTVGVFSCIFFVRKRNRRLEMEDHKILTQSTPKSPDMQDMYFPPPPLSPNRRSRGSGRFSMMLRSKSGNSSEEEQRVQPPATTLQQRTWPRYYPIMPDEGIGIATTTSYPQPVAPVQQAPYIPAPTPSPMPAPVPFPAATTSQHAVSRSSSTATLPSYQPHSSYNAGISKPQPPAPAYIQSQRSSSKSSQGTGQLLSKSRQSNAFSVMTDIEEGEQISSSEASQGEIAENSSCETASNSSKAASTATKKARRPTLTINIPGQAPRNPSLPPPPPEQGPPTKAAMALPGPPPQQTLPKQPNLKIATSSNQQQPSLRRAPSTSSAPMLQELAARASVRSASRPKQTGSAATAKLMQTTLSRPPLLRDEHVRKIPNSPTEILAAASSYAQARGPASESKSRESASSAALPKSDHTAGGASLTSDCERHTSSRSNSSGRRPSRGPSRNSRRGSDASVTSFEDEGEDSEDETPPETNKRLSPVTEASPVATIRYPKIPRGSNQVVPRSPGTPKNTSTSSQPQERTPTRARPEVDTAAAIAATQGIANKLWKTEVTPDGRTLPTPEWTARRRSESWQDWAQNTPEASSAGTLQTPQKPFASGEAPKITPTKRGDELFLDLRFSSSTVGR
ncbi:hypothetical protein, variant [Verruconis gallopava]|nr:hypothetical protein, variant [Verruconis gallopava]KIW03684.1 hypothetical protein, variant [Verruconis gallopava]